MSFSESNTA